MQVIDGEVITAMRTAAASAISAKVNHLLLLSLSVMSPFYCNLCLTRCSYNSEPLSYITARNTSLKNNADLFCMQYYTLPQNCK